MIKDKLKGASIDSLLLTFIKLITSLLGLISTRIISSQFSLHEYGTYSQAMLIVSMGTSFSILGLSDATNFFYNRKYEDEKVHEKYLSTIFSLQYMLGIITAGVILIFSGLLTKYFDNTDLRQAYGWIALMPMCSNLIAMLQVLYVSLGKTKVIAIRNLVFSVLRLIIFAVSAFVLNDIIYILILTLICDILQIVYFKVGAQKSGAHIHIRETDVHLIKTILKYSLPMAGYILLNSLMRDLDKLTISWFMSTEEVAIYTNMSKVLPFDLFSTSMYTVLLPFVTLAITGNHREEAQYIYRQYLNISLITMTIFIVGAMIFSEELVLTLYGDQYLSGLKIFIIYLAVDLIRFANVSLVLSAAGRTKTLLLYSIFSLAANFILNIALYYALGIVGPAAATVIVMLIGNAILMHQSSKVIGKSMFTLFDFKRLLPIVMELIVFGLLFGGLNVFLESRNFYYLLRLVIGYGGFLIVMGLLNLKNILYYLKNINQIKKTTGEESND